MKKLLLLTIITLLSAQYCFAESTIPKELRKQYKADMAQAINKILDGKNIEGLTYREYFTKAYSDDVNWYNNVFLKNKNQMKRNYEFNTKVYSQLGEINENLMTKSFDILKPVIDKYNLELCNNCNAEEYIYINYLKKYRIPRAKEYKKFVTDSGKYVIAITEINDIVCNYSVEYEKQKAENFYNNVVKTKIDANQPYWVQPYLEQNPWDTKTRYAGKATVIQILRGGFLVDFLPSGYNPYPSFNTVAFVKANDAYKLKYGDTFYPYLPFKFTGQYYTYRTYLGERKSVPVFIVAMKQKPVNLPQMGDTFYFIDKPSWGKQHDCSLDKLYVINERRFTVNHRDVYARYR